jgi:hypothetical protein
MKESAFSNNMNRRRDSLLPSPHYLKQQAHVLIGKGLGDQRREHEDEEEVGEVTTTI